MLKIRFSQLRQVKGRFEVFVNKDCLIRGLSFDSRALKRGELFFALRGKNTDGHCFLKEARAKGAAGAVISKDFYRRSSEGLPRMNLVVVSQPEEFLIELARFLRRRLSSTVIGITGSCGKTTTKDILHFLLGKEASVCASPQSFNNFLGVPFTISLAREDTQYLICECGAGFPSQMESLSKIIKPHYSIITNVGPSHLEFFKSIKNVFKEKIKIASFTKKAVLVNADDRYLKSWQVSRPKVVRIGFNRSSHYPLKIKYISFGRIIFNIRNLGDFTLNTGFSHHVYNAAFAVVLGLLLGWKVEALKRRLSTFHFQNMRTQLIIRNNLFIINDAYNSNPASLKEALRSLSKFQGFKRRIVVLGDMHEQGDFSQRFHALAGRWILRWGFDYLFCIGDQSRYTWQVLKSGGFKNAFHYQDHQSLCRDLRKILKKRDLVLIKGSRGMKMEKILEGI